MGTNKNNTKNRIDEFSSFVGSRNNENKTIYIYKKKNPKSRDFCFCCAARSHRSPQRLTSSDGFSLPPTDLFPHPHFIRHFLSFFFLLLLLLSVRPQYIAVVIRQSTSFFSPFIDCYRPIKRRKKNVEEKVHFGSRLFQLLGFPITWTDDTPTRQWEATRAFKSLHRYRPSSAKVGAGDTYLDAQNEIKLRSSSTGIGRGALWYIGRRAGHSAVAIDLPLPLRSIRALDQWPDLNERREKRSGLYNKRGSRILIVLLFLVLLFV